MSITIETNTGYNMTAGIIVKRISDGNVVAVTKGMTIFGKPEYGVYLCAEQGRVNYLEWLSFRDDGKFFASRDEALAYAHALAEM